MTVVLININKNALYKKMLHKLINDNQILTKNYFFLIILTKYAI